MQLEVSEIDILASWQQNFSSLLFIYHVVVYQVFMWNEIKLDFFVTWTALMH